ncbi:phospholipase D-like domain-containing protein [Hoyosella altamirensis]|uniref:Phosphatidylserine/phosphatidylglycerophosphate/ cardiolipin synthase-like enzyme n=1 Tax=Hoyosella altamirensis TaxID=616997 RepID=A0A839RJC9_9ACTN|nr:phospholipase D family protein [Hoyosella altamirensis]MBB3036507.1 phosphatidylserine/phosphatidylglycerophosphate/cardiolipin synthase-like enzyme [Hoyosella altamirensis]
MLDALRSAAQSVRNLVSRSLDNLESPRGGFDSTHPWFLTDRERDNPATTLAPWTSGNAVLPLPHGRTYFERLAHALDAVRTGDLVLFTDWRGDPEQLLTDDGLSIVDALVGAAHRGALVRGLLWRSHMDSMGFHGPENRELVEKINAAGGEVVLDQRVLAFGSHHQKFVVIRYCSPELDDVAFVGGIDLARSRRDDADHDGDPISRPFPAEYGDTPPWHDVQVELRGPAVVDVETIFRERWDDPAALSRLPWQAIPDIVRPRVPREPSVIPSFPDSPPRRGTCDVQLLRTYPRRKPAYPFAPQGERSVARAYAKALHRARSLIYIEDQYLWSLDVARVFAHALREHPTLHMMVVVPRYLDEEGVLTIPSALLGHAEALEELLSAGPDRVAVYNIENCSAVPVYVHAKVCVIDDVWATVGSDNFNRRSWTHDSELTAAIIDAECDARAPADPAGLGDGARVFARDLRLVLAREHLDRDEGDVADLFDPAEFFAAFQASAQKLEDWHKSGQRGPRPPGRLRPHSVDSSPRWQRVMAAPIYRNVVDPDGRPFKMRLTKRF